MNVLDLLKIECFKYYLDILWLIKDYLDIITYLKSFYCIGICLFVPIQFVKALCKVIDSLFVYFLCIFKNYNSAFEWARQCTRNHNLSSNGLLYNPFLCLKTLKNISHNFLSLVVHLRSIKQKLFRKN